MQIKFAPRSTMLAMELDHYVARPIPWVLAAKLIDQMGAMHITTDRFAAWYGDILMVSYHGTRANGERIEMVQGTMPISLSLNDRAECMIRHKMEDTRHIDAVLKAFADLSVQEAPITFEIIQVAHAA